MKLCKLYEPEISELVVAVLGQMLFCAKVKLNKKRNVEINTRIMSHRIPVAFSASLTPQKELTRPSDKPQVSTEVSFTFFEIELILTLFPIEFLHTTLAVP